MAFDTTMTNRPTAETSDEELIQIADRWLEESKPFHEKLKKIQDLNGEYYLGNQTERGRIPSHMADVVFNHVFMGIETIVPIITSNPPQFIVEPPAEDKESARLAENMQKILSVKYETSNVRKKGEMMIRHLALYRMGPWKVYWNEDENDADVRNVRPQRIWIPEYGASVDELPYIMEHMDITFDEFKDVFGEEKFDEFKKAIGSDEEYDSREGEWKNKMEATAAIWEIWTDEMVFWKHGGMIIDKKENPYYNFNDKKDNYFKYPKKPYILTSVFKTGKSVVGDTDLIEQTIPVQDTINKLTRCILDNAIKMGNQTWLIDSDVMDEETARDKITNAPGAMIYGSGAANESLLRRAAPPPIPAYISNFKLMSENTFDNIFGTHSTTRGERQSSEETLGGRLLLKQADIGRLDLIVREYEGAVAELGKWFLQMMSVFYENTRSFRYYGERGIEFIEAKKELIDSGMRVVVKPGTTMPTDELSKRDEAIQLWSMGGLDPITLFERLKFPDPEEAAQRLIDWKQGELEQEIQKEKAVGEAKAGGGQEREKSRSAAKAFVGRERIRQSRQGL